jgi:hypothetical protein
VREDLAVQDRSNKVMTRIKLCVPDVPLRYSTVIHSGSKLNPRKNNQGEAIYTIISSAKNHGRACAGEQQFVQLNRIRLGSSSLRPKWEKCTQAVTHCRAEIQKLAKHEDMF